MTEPRFSIVTVTKDNLAGLHKTARSVEAQTCRDYEWLVIDGGSRDGTQDHYTPVISEADGGIYDAMNKGIGCAKGAYILFLNAGDALAAPDVLESLRAYNADFIYGDAWEDGYLKPARHNIERGMITHHQAMLYRRACIGDLRFDTSLPLAADYDFTWRFMKRSADCLYVPVALCDFESGGVSQRKAAQGRREQFCIRRHRGVPLYVCLAIYLKQAAVQAVRQYAPALFWRVRSRRNSVLSPAHNRTLPRHP